MYIFVIQILSINFKFTSASLIKGGATDGIWWIVVNY